MSPKIVPTWIIGRRGLLVEGIIVSIERSSFLVRQCCDQISDFVFDGVRPDERHLCVHMLEIFGFELSQICKNIETLRRQRPGAFIVCIANDFAVDDEPLIAAGANGCFSGHFQSSELNLLLSFILSNDRDMSVVVTPRVATGDRLRALPDEVQTPNTFDSAEAISSTIILGETKLRPQSILALSGREREVLAGLINGDSNKALARKLVISEATVKAHVRTVFRKLGAHSRTQAIRNLLESCPAGSSVNDWLMANGMESSVVNA